MSKCFTVINVKSVVKSSLWKYCKRVNVKVFQSEKSLWKCCKRVNVKVFQSDRCQKSCQVITWKCCKRVNVRVNVKVFQSDKCQSVEFQTIRLAQNKAPNGPQNCVYFDWQLLEPISDVSRPYLGFVFQPEKLLQKDVQTGDSQLNARS